MFSGAFTDVENLPDLFIASGTGTSSDTPKHDSRCNEDPVHPSIESVWPLGPVYFDLRPQQLEQLVLESEVGQKRCAQPTNISSRVEALS
jgi:hypothetical protein